MITSHDRPLRLGVAPPVSQQIIGVQTIYWCFDELLALPPALPSAFSARRARALEGILSAFSARRARALEGILSAFSAMRGELLPPRHPLSMPTAAVNRTASIMKMMTRLTSFARLCAVVVAALLSVGGFGGTNDGDAAVLMARAQPLAGPRCVNRFPQKPLCKFVDDLAASPLTFLDASTGETINLGAYAVSQVNFQICIYELPNFHRLPVPSLTRSPLSLPSPPFLPLTWPASPNRSSTATCPPPRCMRMASRATRRATLAPCSSRSAASPPR
ncbi:unnamed protein product [Closterium sp. Yama58-4]|nr:unnamed protein product [Closterium sp. Yama58-4]